MSVSNPKLFNLMIDNPTAEQSVLWNVYCDLYYGSEERQSRQQNPVY